LISRAHSRGPAVALALAKRNLNIAETCGFGELLDGEAVNQVLTGRTKDHRQSGAEGDDHIEQDAGTAKAPQHEGCGAQQ